jgi:hypothetical protein
MYDKSLEFIMDAISGDVASSCCDAAVIAGDICMDCKEHCTPILIEEE